MTFQELEIYVKKNGITRIKNVLPYNAGIKYADLNLCGNLVFRKQKNSKIFWNWGQAYNKNFII